MRCDTKTWRVSNQKKKWTIFFSGKDEHFFLCVIQTMLKPKHVTWSPLVKPVSRPTSVKKRPCRPKTSNFRLSIDTNDNTQQIKHGQLIAHSRKNTHSLLLTIRKGAHRDFQLLVDLPSRRIRRIYDGAQSWTVRSTHPTTMELFCNIGTITWRDDDERRKANTPGFRLDWLNGTHHLRVGASHTQRSGASRKKPSRLRDEPPCTADQRRSTKKPSVRRSERRRRRS
jgi:hypothetical protein